MSDVRYPTIRPKRRAIPGRLRCADTHRGGGADCLLSSAPALRHRRSVNNNALTPMPVIISYHRIIVVTRADLLTMT